MNADQTMQYGNQLQHEGKFTESIEVFCSIPCEDDLWTVSRYFIGVSHMRRGDFIAAKCAFIESLAKFSEFTANTFQLLIDLSYKLGQENDAVRYTNIFAFVLRELATRNPDKIDLYIQFARLRCIDTKIAIEHTKLGLTRNPLSVSLMIELSCMYYKTGHVDDAIDICTASNIVSPSAQAYNNLALSYIDIGELNLAFDAIDAGLSIDNTVCMHQAILTRCYQRRLNIGKMISYCDGMYTQLQFMHPMTTQRALTPVQKLRIGYVSGDFKRHSVSYFIESVLKYSSNVTNVCYSNLDVEDETTKRLRPTANEWRCIHELPTNAVVEMIQADNIDILVDLSGHTAWHRMDVFSAKPAPIQVTWIGFPSTTGMKSIDYKIVDFITDPVDTTEYYTEQLHRVNGCFLCYTPSEAAPDVIPVQSAVIRFGSFNTAAKINASVLKTWCSILTMLPSSILVIKCKGAFSERYHTKISSIVSSHGVDPDRIHLTKLVDGERNHLDAYNSIDIALDSFPYNGTTTTCEALYMGVPVVTIKGSRHMHNVGASLLTCVGEPGLIANTIDEYVQIAVSLAVCTERREKLKASLRSKMLASPLCDGPAHARKIELAYMGIWNKSI